MKEIRLTQGQVALVDDEDYEWLSQWKWCASFDSTNQRIYAKGWAGGTRLTYMHRIIMDAKHGDIVDHQNHNTLDCRRANLLLTDASGNGKNASLRRNNKSGVCGVIWDRDRGAWRAELQSNNKRLYIGRFKFMDDAIEARRHASVLHGFHPNHGH